MAQKFVNGTLTQTLTNSNDIVRGDLNVPFTVLVFGKEIRRRDQDHREVAVMLGCGKSITVSVPKDAWNDSWENIFPGLIISFDGNVANAKSRIRVTSISDAIAHEDPVTFERGELPSQDTDNCSMVLTVGSVVDRSLNHAAPAKMICFTGMGTEVIVQSFFHHHISLIESRIIPGTIIHVGPAGFKADEFNGNVSLIISCYQNSVIFDAGKPTVEPDDMKNVACIADLKNHKAGAGVCLKVVLLRHIYQGCVSVVDVPGTDDDEESGVKPYRVVLTGIPNSITGKPGTIVDIEAVLAAFENIQLNHVKMTFDAASSNKPVQLKPFPRYQVLTQVKTAPAWNPARKRPSQSSQGKNPSRNSSSSSSSGNQKNSRHPSTSYDKLSQDMFEDDDDIIKD